ncbi:hypothetical protein [Flavilitoribacter nigricans]|uniref:Uncharacterized protein n=1 Tax=Flavilitoribacter nigricans (strain ATCC 23147 / DSM 23189 / NBRC 102662 / NCIMB 1420 / SS-2) TaxID=1122177 RepID=A0A2D0N452_FLAN2|nr:hypothetical protein [Flavilitoribacter nigricans]PHN02543.1 hypothetical protein CRP01_31705 [Flavilitoribacter nigricans DSM 23189 = NBRC 102662]
MKKFARYLLITCCAVFFITAILIFRPVPIVYESKAIAERRTVSEIYSNPGNDIIFRMEDTPRRFYINRGLENGLDLDELKEKLIGNAIVVKYPKYWTPLDWNNSVRHISKVEFDGEVLFNEFKR